MSQPAYYSVQYYLAFKGLSWREEVLLRSDILKLVPPAEVGNAELYHYEQRGPADFKTNV
jgi:hypothetical protein